jgi:hypothetical protein
VGLGDGDSAGAGLTRDRGITVSPSPSGVRQVASDDETRTLGAGAASGSEAFYQLVADSIHPHTFSSWRLQKDRQLDHHRMQGVAF